MAIFIPNSKRTKPTILDNLTREEVRFARTVEAGTAHLQNLLSEIRASNKTMLDGHIAFDLYATYGLPFEIRRDIAREQGSTLTKQVSPKRKKNTATPLAAAKPWANSAAKIRNSSRRSSKTCKQKKLGQRWR